MGDAMDTKDTRCQHDEEETSHKVTVSASWKTALCVLVASCVYVTQRQSPEKNENERNLYNI